MDPFLSGGDDLFGISGPPEQLRLLVVMLLGLVRRGVIENEMHIAIYRELLSNGVEEVDDLLAPVACTVERTLGYINGVVGTTAHDGTGVLA